MNIKVIIGDSRKMPEVPDDSIGLVVTSPPYWHIKDYGTKGQIGYGQTLHEYLKDIYRVWNECYKKLLPGRRLCINIGDQFARSIIYGRYKVIPLHAEIISQCEEIGFDYMGSIIWQKKTTMNTTGGANVMGSYPYPPNGLIEIDYEFILIFKKPGNGNNASKESKKDSALSKEEWKTYFTGHWNFGGAKQIGHEAMFPEELPLRLIKMFTFVGDIVLDPFLGSGTTIKAATQLKRNSIGYEINEDFLEIIRKKIDSSNLFDSDKIEIIKRESNIIIEDIEYIPKIKNAKPNIEPSKFNFKNGSFYKIVEIIGPDTIRLNSGLLVKFLGVKIIDEKKALEYLKENLLKKEIIIKFDKYKKSTSEPVEAYVYLKNKIFINAYLIKSGMAVAEKNNDYSYKDKFLKLENIELCQKNGY
ncbi:MAG TPA: DNA methyltransferase [Spirochaetota bacterium]|nr:DNA methyltransferase [Spirochaetota bacterium]HOM11272.1 DNA methyltransferase [Spirochaetota bacterium]HPP51097.1 DNA methyltransferase [Spirochaetota bacterium]